MFRRVRKEETPNRLSDEAEPNKLSLDDESRPNELDLDSGEHDDEFDEDEFDEDEEELDPEERARQAAELQAELQRQAEEYGLTGSDPEALYGPNGQAVAELLDSLGDVDDDTAEAIADAYWSVPEADRKVARSVISRRHRGGDLELELQAAERAVADWLNALNEEGVADVYTVVAEAATDAVDALVLDDKLADIDFDTLYGPWGDVMDSEEDDEAEGEDEEELPEAVEAALDKVDAARAEEAEVVAEEGQFGPNDGLVMALLDKLAGLSGAEISELVAAWRRQPKDELRVAHHNLQDLTEEDHQWREQLRLAQEEVFAWMAGHAGEGRLDYSISASGSTPEVRRSAGPVAADAVAALVMADILEREDAVTLYAPWAEVVGTPELPEYEDEGEGEEGEPE
jgi:hypothetical protein